MQQVIITCDDFGMHPTINRATLHLLKRGLVKSASILPSAPYFHDAVHMLHLAGITHIGVHLALGSEYPAIGLRAVLPHESVSSLTGTDGVFLSRDGHLPANARLPEIRSELAGQIDRVLAAKLTIDHIDSHMFFSSKALGGLAVNTLVKDFAAELGVPCRSSPGETRPIPLEMIWSEHPTIEGRHKFYRDLFRRPAREPYELIIHPADDGPALATFTKNGDLRLGDFSFFSSDEFAQMCADQTIDVISWKQWSMPAANEPVNP